MLDADSRAILRHLQKDPALTVPDLVALTRLSAAKVGRRLDRMTEDGVILGQAVIIDWAALGYAVQVSLRITLDKTVARAFDDFLSAARKLTEVSLVARDLPHYQDIYRNQILTLPHIADIEALMTVAVVKSEKTLPL
jgi:Lrp/AsnC family transcriptional regulator